MSRLSLSDSCHGLSERQRTLEQLMSVWNEEEKQMPFHWRSNVILDHCSSGLLESNAADAAAIGGANMRGQTREIFGERKVWRKPLTEVINNLQGGGAVGVQSFEVINDLLTE